MKPTHFFKDRRNKLAGAILICLSFTAMCPFALQAGTTEVAEPAAEEPEAAANWATFTFGGFAVSDNDAAFQRRHGNNGDFFGGIESFHLEQEMESGRFNVDGHALFGLEDYEVILGYERDDLGFVRGGYREFRTWYDGSGGFLPGASTPAGWIDPITLTDDELELDRGELWFEAGIRMEDIPSITFGYSHRWRNGKKDTTIWEIEDTSLWGLPAGDDRGVVPGFYDIDETSDIFWLDVEHTVYNTDLVLSLRYQIDDNDNTRQASTQTVPETRDVWETDLFSSSLTSTTRFNEQMMLSFGYLFTTLDTDVDGTLHDQTTMINGGSQFSQNVANSSFWWNPIEDLVVAPSVRVEWQNINAMTTGPGAPNSSSGLQSSGIDLFESAEEIEIRYSGLANILLYGKAEWCQIDKDFVGFEGGRNSQDQEIDTDVGKYTIGANYYPMSGLTLSSQYYYRNLDQDYDNDYDDLTNPALDGQLYDRAVDTHDFNIRATWRALPCLTFVSRYDYQVVSIDTRAYWDLSDVNNPGVTDTIESAEITRHVLSESVTWNATQQFYVQGSVHWICSQTDTPADSDANAVDPRFVPDWDNDYFTASLNAGYAVARNTDLILGYTFYSADNYLDNSDLAVPYGTDAVEHALTLTMIQRINENLIWNVRYGYFQGEDDAFGGYNDYEAHMVSTGLQVRF